MSTMQIPKRFSLVAQTVAILKEHILPAAVDGRLPSERELCVQLKISRMTVRMALEQLAREGLVRSAGRGQPRLTAKLPKKRALLTPAERRVVILSPLPLHSIEPRVMFWVDELRESLTRAGCQLEFLTHRNTQSKHPEHAIDELAARLRPAAWILHQSPAPMQQWFSSRGLPAVVVGTCHEGVQLPSVDVDHQATCRHAVGKFVNKGHRRMAVINPHPAAAGDLDSEHAFCEAAAATGAAATAAQHDGTVRSVCACLDLLLKHAEPPTAFLVSRPTYALSALGHLVLRGFRPGKDLALISRDHDSFLDHAVPSMACYNVDPIIFAHKVSRLALAMISGADIHVRKYRIVPKFVPGQTLG